MCYLKTPFYIIINMHSQIKRSEVLGVFIITVKLILSNFANINVICTTEYHVIYSMFFVYRTNFTSCKNIKQLQIQNINKTVNIYDFSCGLSYYNDPITFNFDIVDYKFELCKCSE